MCTRRARIAASPLQPGPQRNLTGLLSLCAERQPRTEIRLALAHEARVDAAQCVALAGHDKAAAIVLDRLDDGLLDGPEVVDEDGHSDRRHDAHLKKQSRR